MSLHLSLSLLFLSSYILLAFSTQMLIQYYKVPLSTAHSKLAHSLYYSAFHNITLPDPLYPNTQSGSSTLKSDVRTCLSYSLCQVPFQQIHWLHNLISLTTSCKCTMNLTYFFPRLTQFPHLSSIHNLWCTYQFVYILRCLSLYLRLLTHICLSLQGLVILLLWLMFTVYSNLLCFPT